MTKSKTKDLLDLIAWITGVIASIIAIISFFYTKESKIDLSGNWEMTVKINKSSLDRFDNNNLEYKYRIFLVQNGNSIEGDGEKFWEKFRGKETLYSFKQKTQMTVKGKISKNKFTAIIHERGEKRETFGQVEFEVVDDESIINGKFKTTAANSSGDVLLKRKYE